jgi:REP-associated tyrosine transposase
MSTQIRDESPGYHHVFTRGNNKRITYKSDADRRFFCATVDRVAKKNGWSIVASCLMRNHYHLIVVVGDKGLAAGMCELNTAYAIHYNQRHGRINHLFGRRYGSKPLRTEASVMNALRYVVQNPWRAGGKKPLEKYVWSSYAATIGVAFAQIKLDRDSVLSFFGATPEAAIESYKEFCSRSVFLERVRRQPP